MKLKLWAATIGALLAMPVSALAQQFPSPADPADPRSAGPAAVYESAITNTPQSEPEQNQPTPDKVWREANEAVAGAQGHAGHGADSPTAAGQGDAGHASAPPAVPAPPAKPVDEPAADHSKHH